MQPILAGTRTERFVDYEDRNWGIRFGEALMPKVANGINLDWNVHRAHAENLEIQVQPSIWRAHKTTVRLLSYVNHANMGSYREAIDAFVEGRDPEPTIEAHRRQGRKKYGFLLNGEQQLTEFVQIYARAGWNEGRHESFAYTEVNQSVSFGGAILGNRWHRPLDKGGIAATINAISGDHRGFLQLGGKGFLLGDGTLNYSLEKIMETYYTAHLARGISASIDFQHISHPGYNRDRGPVFVPSLRLHLEF